jgi:hypothetical protein
MVPVCKGPDQRLALLTKRLSGDQDQIEIRDGVNLFQVMKRTEYAVTMKKLAKLKAVVVRKTNQP